MELTMDTNIINALRQELMKYEEIKQKYELQENKRKESAPRFKNKFSQEEFSALKSQYNMVYWERKKAKKQEKLLTKKCQSPENEK